MIGLSARLLHHRPRLEPDCETTSRKRPVADARSRRVARLVLGSRSLVAALGALLIAAPLTLAGCRGLSPESSEHLRLGQEASRAGELERAIGSFTTAIDVASELSMFYTTALLERGDASLGLFDASRRGGASPTPRENELLANAQADFQAVSTWDRPSRLDRAWALGGQARVFLRRSSPHDAIRLFEEVIAIPFDASDPDRDQIRERHLEAHRHAGWLLLGESLPRIDENVDTDASRDETLRRAQEHFYAGLEISNQDALCNLGSGICLHLRGSSTPAISHLESYLAEVGDDNADPRGYFFLAAAKERSGGLQQSAIELYRRALDADPPSDFLPLYRHRYAADGSGSVIDELIPHYVRFASVLPRYLSPDAPAFRYFLEKLLSVDTANAAYWQQVEQLGRALLDIEREDSEVDELARITLARACAMTGRTSDAVEWLASLGSSQRIDDWVERLFPSFGVLTPRSILGRALYWTAIGRREALESWLRSSPVESTISAAVKSDAAAREVLRLRASNLLYVYENADPSAPPPVVDATNPESPGPLVLARKAFEDSLFNEEDPAARVEAQRGLGRTLEHLRSYGEALATYEALLRTTPNDEIYGRVMKLHESSGLKENERAIAWTVLRGYTGTDTKILVYMRDLRESLVGRVCEGCGRRNTRERRICIECGRIIPLEPPAGP
jgi:tetratricopeptide (TPR) repeat protein